MPRRNDAGMVLVIKCRGAKVYQADVRVDEHFSIRLYTWFRGVIRCWGRTGISKSVERSVGQKDVLRLEICVDEVQVVQVGD